MAINFEAANMVGYNNPKIVVLKAEVNLTTVISAPKLADIKNLYKSGFIPVIRVTDQGTGGSTLLWPTSIISEGDCSFSSLFIVPSSLTPVLTTLAYVASTGAASFSLTPLQPGT